ncbi:MAG: 4Fe-4S dicluster domain-containing protein, partial [Planctomycetaceae bacterium]|nr:4Fe-4S dicluster domain-containing protein [Planctomycetaceae bacterium]
MKNTKHNTPQTAGQTTRPTPVGQLLTESDRVDISRRRFLEAAGFSFSLLTLQGCSKAPVEYAIPFTDQPEGFVPGKARQFATTCSGCAAGCGLLVNVRDGRPLKMEGMPEHPLSHGGLCAIGQALPLGLYDSHRLKHPLYKGEASDWSEIDNGISGILKEINQAPGKVRFVTSTITSPTLQSAINAFLTQFPDSRHITLDAENCSAILTAHQQTHGARILPRYAFDQADVIVSLGADFLGTWISPVEFTAAWRTRRVPTTERPEMSFHVQLEGRMSLTGSNADRRFRLAPDEFSGVLNQLYVALAERVGQTLDRKGLEPSAVTEADLAALVDRLWNSQGHSLVLCDSQNVSEQILVNAINHLLGNYGKTIDIDRRSRQRQGNDSDVVTLIDELISGNVSALFVAGTDLTHNLPMTDALAEAISKVRLLVSFSERSDDFASRAHFVCPDHHPLESWMDAEPVSGIVSLCQPLLAPLGKTRSVLESLASWSGQNSSALEIVRATWERDIMPRTKSTAFQPFWDQAVHDGFVEVTPLASTTGEFRTEVVKLVLAAGAPGDYCLSLYFKVGMTDSRHAHNPWLQELPDPVTKVTWDNYVSVSAATAARLGITDGDVVRVAIGEDGDSIELPTLIQRGQHDRVIAIALGYGVKGTDRFSAIGPQWLESRLTVDVSETVGKNAAIFIKSFDGALHHSRNDITIQKVGRRHDLATTQEHHTLEIPRNVAPHGAEVRDVVQQTSLAAFALDPRAGTPVKHVESDVQLWAEDHPKKQHAWGMSIDLNACTGCSACLVACQSENNVPVVGKDEVRRQREMHWIRIDRYYAGEEDDVQVSHQPMMCQHCDNAPCETVCPVLATTHSDDGLNQMTYNRCVGTKYCSNNCPYKVRRFNWYNNNGDMNGTLEHPIPLSKNPEVTLRSRGVMEKCTF